MVILGELVIDLRLDIRIRWGLQNIRATALSDKIVFELLVVALELSSATLLGHLELFFAHLSPEQCL